MPWKDKFKQLRNEVEGFISPGQQQQQQQPYPGQYQPQQGYYNQPQYPYHQQQHPQQFHPPPPGPPPQGYYGSGPQQHQAPPPIPPHPAQDQPPPVPPHPPQVHWQPKFSTDVPISEEWDAKLGNADGWGNQELQFYTADSQNAFHTPDGKLVLRALANSSAPPEHKYTSARLVSKKPLGQDRGVLTATILSPCAEGIWPAFWLLPKEPFSWPTDGEIDIAETWNGDHENHTCLHWGQHHETQKHRVLGTKIPDMHARPVTYDFAWDERGRMIWYIDGRPIMKGQMPEGTRPLREMTVLLNIAMGGNVCGGKTPRDGWYDMVVFVMKVAGELDHGGWGRFEADWGHGGVGWGNTY